MGLLKEKLKSEGNNVHLYSLKEKLLCTRMLPSGVTCRKETEFAIVIEKDSDFLIFPVCEKHLPNWAQEKRKAVKPRNLAPARGDKNVGKT